jgi:hypothetical protein
VILPWVSRGAGHDNDLWSVWRFISSAGNSTEVLCRVLCSYLSRSAAADVSEFQFYLAFYCSVLLLRKQGSFVDTVPIQGLREQGCDYKVRC